MSTEMAHLITVEHTCTCSGNDMIFCGLCGGILNLRTGTKQPSLLEKMEPSIVTWLTDIELEGRLNSTLATYASIDRQFKQGAPIGEAVSYAISEIGSKVGSLQTSVEGELSKEFQEIINRNEVSAKQLTETVSLILKEQIGSVTGQIQILLEQGKAISEAGGLLKETAGNVQAVLASQRIANVRGEEAEIQTIQNLREAFFGVQGIEIEPVGGADATDAVVTFLNNGVEMGRLLVEIKARRTWSNDFLDQVRHDLQRYSAPLAILIADKLPRNARGKGFSIDTENGLIVIIGSELAFQTMSMFYELHCTVFKLQKKALDLSSLSSHRDLLFYVNDNLRCIDDCKQISDIAEGSTEKIRSHVASISSRLQENNRKVAEILAKFSIQGGEKA